jgi:malonyl-CoA/methylmalonyl-CoA synthetase
MNLPTLFDLSLKARASQVALEFAGRTYTFGELDNRSNQFGRELASRGLQAGDRLSVFLENRIEFVDLFLACAKLGIIFQPINILYREREVSHILKDAAPKGVVSGSEVPGGFAYWSVDELRAAAETQSSDPIATTTTGDSPAIILYTSGTTGPAKGAVLTHNNVASNAVNLLTCWQITDRDRFLLALPLFHVHGLANGLCCWLLSGCRMRLLERFDHQKTCAEFLEFKPSLFFAVPTIYVRMLSWRDELARQIGASARLFVSGSAPLPANVHAAFHQKYQHTILERYGMTETLMNLSNPYTGERRAGTVGFPLPGISAKIASEDGTELAPEEVGEVWMRGPNIFAGYWQRDAATRAAFKDGWFRTGDVGVRSADGYFTLRGRMSDLIISGGFNIYPREIEELLLEQPGVKEVSVVGVPDSIRGEIPVAYIVVDEAFSEEQTLALLKSQLASFKIPRGFVKVDALPRTALGKIQKHLLPTWQG